MENGTNTLSGENVQLIKFLQLQKDQSVIQQKLINTLKPHISSQSLLIKLVLTLHVKH